MSNELLRVVNFSGGLCSFWAAWRVKERFGTQRMVLLFADTLIEDSDLYIFNEQASKLLGVPITRLSTGEDPWSLFRREGLIGNNRFPICSVRLKREPLNGWIARECRNRYQELQGDLWDEEKPAAVLYVGFDWNEQHRLNDLRAELPEWQIEAPMVDEPVWDKCRMQMEAEALGLKIPMLYGLGFPHNNCGGRCVRAGISHWVHLYRVLRPRFIEWRDEERRTRYELLDRGIEPFSILKDRRGGVTRPLWLEDLERRIEAGEQFDKYDWGGCGCGGATQELVTL